MFDAKSILEGLVRGANSGGGQPGQSGGGLADILGQVLGGGAQQPRGRTTPQSGAQDNDGGFGGLGDILGQLGGGQQRDAGPASERDASTGTSGSGGLGDIIAEIQKQLGQGGGAATPRNAAGTGDGAQTGGGGGLGDLLNQIRDRIGQQGGAGEPGGGSIMDVLGQVLAQATQGAKDGATRIGDATGAKDAVGRATVRTPEDILAQLKELVQQNPLAAGTAAG